MKKIVTLLSILTCCYVSAIENPKGGARALAMSDAAIAISDIWGTFHNQAGLAKIQNLSTAVFYSSKFNIKEQKDGRKLELSSR